MKHPTQEEWIEFLYSELPPGKQKESAKHLQSCSECHEKVAQYRQAMQSLDEWKLAAPRAQSGRALRSSYLKWAAAALVVISTSFAVGRTTATQPDLEELKAKLEQPLRSTLEADLKTNLSREFAAQFQSAQEQVNAGFAQQLEKMQERALAQANRNLEQSIQALTVQLAAWKDEERRQVLATLKEMESQRVAELFEMRKDLETLALQADQRLRSAQRQLVQLATYTQPIDSDK